ncbi:hypothetical protein D3C81_1796590 [compost metagenome]
MGLVRAEYLPHLGNRAQQFPTTGDVLRSDHAKERLFFFRQTRQVIRPNLGVGIEWGRIRIEDAARLEVLQPVDHTF